MSCSRAEHTIEYLKPSQLFRETMKRDYYHNPAFLGFSFTDEYVRVAISDGYYAWIHGEFPRDKTHLDKLVEVIHSVQNDPVEKYELLGIIIDDNNSVENIHNLMDNLCENLCEKGNFKSLKYTCWKDDIESENSSFGRAPFGFLFWRKTIYSELHERLEVFSAQNMLQSFLDFFSALYMDEDEELEDKDEEMEDKDLEMEDKDLEMEDKKLEMEDKDLEMEDSKTKMIKYLKPLQFYRETIVSDYVIPVLPLILGLSFTDEYAVVEYSINYYMTRQCSEFRRDETLLDMLLEVLQHIQRFVIGKSELLGIVVEDNNYVKDIHNLLDDLCKKGDFKSLKYTFWKGDIGSKNSSFGCDPFGFSFFSVQDMLLSFLDCFRALCIDKYEEIEVKDDKSEDSEIKKQCKIIQ